MAVDDQDKQAAERQYEAVYTAALGFVLGSAFWWLCLFLYLEGR